ncbi:hypothetical protein [Oceanicella sp. SM1341]|uniref:hypothetical protein n=1 Tax=Oceanicella sp. SM1341 TaxID=1548889 RepID=UPI000E4C44E4|nr:hypothetical protein [Oceanicella sp. SM1341]
MKHALRHRILLIAVTLTVAAGAVVSALHMSAGIGQASRIGLRLAHAVAAADICGDAPHAREYHCPFCNLTDDAGRPSAPDGCRQARAVAPQVSPAGLPCPGRRLDHCMAPRAPPATA